MAELKGLARQTFLKVFLPAYNRLHETAYAGEPEEDPHHEWDYRWAGRAPGTLPLLVQHTRAGSDEGEERKKPAVASRWNHDEIHGPLRAVGLRGCRVHLWIHRLPDRPEDRKAIGAAIREVVRKGALLPLAVGERRTLELIEVRGGIAQPELEGTEADFLGASITGPGFAFDEEHVAERALPAVLKKQAHFGPSASDVVLAIFFDLTPYDDGDVKRMVAALKLQRVTFREVWAVSPWQPEARCDRLWPV